MYLVNKNVLLWLLFSLSVLPSSGSGLELTPKERKWLREHPVVHVGLDSASVPYQYLDASGLHQGMAADYLDYISAVLGISFELDRERNIKQALQAVIDQDLDMLAVLAKTPDRDPLLNFTEPYVYFSRVILTRTEHKDLNHVEALEGKTVSVLRGSSDEFYIDQSLKEQLKITVSKFQTVTQALRALSEGRVDAMISESGVALHEIDSLGLKDIVIAGETDNRKLGVHMAVRKDWRLFTKILQKAMDEMPAEVKIEIEAKWLKANLLAEEEHEVLEEVSNTLMIAVLAFLGILFPIVVLVLLSQQRLLMLFNNRWFQLSVPLILIIASGVSILSMNSAYQVKEANLKQRSEDILESILYATREGIQKWVFSEIGYWQRSIQSEEIHNNLVSLLRNTNDQQTPQRVAEILAELRGQNSKPVHFILLDEQLELVASSGNSEQSRVQHIKSRQPDVLDAGLRGLTGFINPFSDNAGHLLQYFVLPVYSNPADQSHELGLMLIDGGFSKPFDGLLDFWEIGNNIDVYAFDDKGYLLSSLDDQRALSGLGLIPVGNSPIGSLQLLDFKSDQMQLDVEPSRFIWPVQMGLAGKSGSNMEGYRNIIGKKMVGNVLWDHGLSIGYVIEVPYKTTWQAHEEYVRRGWWALLPFILVNILIYILMFGLAYRANRYLMSSNQSLEQQSAAASERADQKESQYQMLVENLTGAVYRLDINTHRLSYISDASIKLLGYNAAEINAMPNQYLDLIHPDDRAILVDAELKAQETDRRIDVTYRVIHKNGRTLWVTDRAVVQQINNVLEMHGTLFDVTDDVLAQQEVIAKEKLLSSVSDNVSDAVIMLDERGLVLFWSKSATDMFGYSEVEILQHKASHLIVAESQRKFVGDALKEVYRKGVSKQLSQQNEMKGLRKDGSEFNAEVSISPVKQQFGFGLVAVVRDISVRKQAEQVLKEAKREAELAAKTKADFLANMSHEIRTPLNAILGMTHLCLQGNLDSTQKRYLGKIDKASNSLLAIINDILDFSKLEAGKMTAEKVEFALHDTMAEVLDMMLQRAQSQKNRLLLYIDPDVPLDLLGDVARIRQVLINLLGNAVKFTQDGNVLLSVSKTAQTDTGVQVLFEVIDSGIGMSESQLSQLFQDFHQADSSITRKYGGTGLGLAISKKLVDLMAGSIGVESSEGLGSRFYFELHLPFAQDVKYWPSLCSLVSSSLIIVDGDALSADILNCYLDELAVQPQWLSSIDGLERCLEQCPNTVLIINTPVTMSSAFNLNTLLSQLAAMPESSRPRQVITIVDEGVEVMAHRALNHEVCIRPLLPLTLVGLLLKDSRTELAEIFTPKPSKSKAQSILFDNCSVLLVEDNELNQEVAADLLAKVNITPDIASDGQQAVVMAEKKPYQLVLMDLQMPIMDGFEATRLIRKSHLDLPVIAMTANVLEQDRQRCLDLGMNDFIAKPIEVEDMYQVIARYLPHQKSDEDNAHNLDDTSTLSAPTNIGDSAASDAIEIEGMDVRNALLRMSSDVSLYKRQLGKFCERYKSSHEEFEFLINQRAYQELERNAHTLKGLSGTVGAVKVQAPAAQFEALAKQRQGATQEHNDQELLDSLATIKEALSITISNITAFLNSQKHEGGSVEVSTSDFVALLEEMLPLLEEDDTEVMEYIETLSKLKGQYPESQEILEHIESYDFGQALALVKTLLITMNQ